MLEIFETRIPEIKVLIPKRFGDNRGFFSESWNKQQMANLGLDYEWVQDNHSYSVVSPTVRGLHFQSPPHAQAKLVRCGQGRLFDVAVDIRKGSPTFGQWVGHDLSATNGAQLLIPEGFLHGFVTREPNTEIIYKCSDYYAPECDRAVRFDDSEIGIDWGIDPAFAVLSSKDQEAPFFRDFGSPFQYQG